MADRWVSADEATRFQHALLAAAAAAPSIPELGTELSGRLNRFVPHNGYMLAGLDPLTGVGCFHHKEHGYSVASAHRLEADESLGTEPHLFADLMYGPGPVGVLSAGSSRYPRSVRSHDLMPAEGFGSEMRIALTHRGVPWGGLILLREHGSEGFSEAEAQCAERLAEPMAIALRRYVAGKPLRPGRRGLSPGVVVIGPDDSIKGMTSTARTWLREFVPESARAKDEELTNLLWGMTYHTRRTNSTALSRIPTGEGWVAAHAQFLDGADGDITITFQSAPASLLLPAICAWYGLTPRERAIVEHLLGGLPTKHIARLLGMSPHTVAGHLRSLYRKTGTAGREELIAGLRQ
ncbi:helix-turn-helix transcriptional regulator [Streptomyces sp. NPDC052396]|uniref:helix-turn-helix transcriptional regulator n=1 Tax=Streptomyces sp. NPDC052396 TaxID=3365689 RepID=UPI0037D67097